MPWGLELIKARPTIAAFQMTEITVWICTPGRRARRAMASLSVPDHHDHPTGAGPTGGRGCSSSGFSPDPWS